MPSANTDDHGAEHHDGGFPTKQLATLAICRLAEPIAFTSIMAYTYVMVKGFQGGDATNASFYAGLLVSAFAVAEACTAMMWGTISDRYGRKPIILLGLAGTALSSLLFGFATNIWVALTARVVGGLLNGNVAVMQTMVAEICTKPEYEPRGYAMVPFMWSLGTIFGAAMGGYLAEPAHYYPGLFSQDGLFGVYPYLLPNLVAVGFILVAIIQGYFFLEETNVRVKAPRLSIEEDDHEPVIDEYTPLQRARSNSSTVREAIGIDGAPPSFISGSMPTTTESSFNLRRGSVGTLYSVRSSVTSKTTPIIPINGTTTNGDSHPPPKAPKAFTRAVRLWILALVIMCYHQMAFAALVPIYFLDPPSHAHPTSNPPLDLHGGLGYTVHDVGAFMSVNGVLALCIQATIFPLFVSRVGVWRSLVSLLTLCPTTYILMPLLSLLAPHSLARRFGVYGLLALQNFHMIVIYPCLLIALKNATPSSSVLGRVNGLAMSACSGARTLAPPLGGIIYGKVGSAGAWWSIAAVAGLGIVELYFWLPRPGEAGGGTRGEEEVTVESVFKGAKGRSEEVEGDGVV